MNGDGRLDYVESPGGNWQVYFNTGEGLSAAVTWTGVDPFPGAPGNWIEWWKGVPLEGGSCYHHKPKTRLFDLNSDGFPDWLYAQSPSTWIVRHSSDGGRSNELVEVHNGFGAVYEIRYKAAGVFRAEGLVCDGGPLDGKPCESAQECGGAACSPAAEKPVYAPFPVRVVESVYLRTGYADTAIGEGYDFLTEFRYSGPAYDPEEREFRGFRWTVEVDPQRGRRTETEFRQAADPFDPSSRAQARPYRRKPARRRVVDATTGSLLVEEVFTWQAPTLPDGRRQVTLSSRSETRYGTDGTSSQTLSRAFLYDEFANPVLVQESADGQPVRTTSASYSYDLGSYIVDRPAQIHRAGLASRRFTYDSRGNPTRIEDWLDTRGVWVSTDSVYDAAGLLVSRTDPRGYTTTVDWSCNLGLYPCTVTDPLGHQQGTTYDLRWGRISELVDANGATTSYDYDSFGRLASIVRVPAIDPEPWRKFTYVFGSAPMPSRIETHVREPYGYRREVVFFDSVGRELQRRRDDVVDGAATVVVSDAVKFDEAGRIRSRTVPYETTQPVDFWYPPPGTQKTTEFEYDALDRESKRTHPNGTYRTWDYSVAGRVFFRDENATAYDDGKRTNVSGAGRRTENFYDALGRLLETKEYDGPMDATGLRSHVRYAYDGLDRLLSVTTYAEDGTAFTTSFSYDSLGRRIELSDPNSGVWRYEFDVVGNPVYQDDPEPGRHVEMCYDELGRLHCRYTFSDDSWSGERICPSSQACPSIPGGTLVEEYFHDVACSNGKGRLCAVEDSSGWTSFSYDARGRLVESTKEIRAAGLVRNFTFETTYDVADRVQSLLYPTRSGTENVTYLYDNAGRLLAANAPGASYFFDAQYDVFGRPTNLRYGNGAVATWEYYASGENRFRLQRIKVVRNSSTLQHFKYTAYDKAGNLLRIVDPNGYGYSDSSTLDNDWQFSYDGLGRLVEMVPPSHPQWQGTQDFAYDRLSNLTRRGSLSIEHALSTGFPNRILATDPPGMAQSFEYDASGELLRRPETTGGGSEAYAISYDALGRVSRIEAQGSVVEYVRDYTGRVAAKLVDGVPTFYFGELFELRGDQLVRHVYAGERRIAQNVATLSESSPLLLAQAGGGSELLLLAALLDGRRLERLEQALGTSRETLKLLALASFLLLLGLTPGRVRPRLAHQRLVFFGWVRQGHVLLLLFVFGTSVLPLTCVSSARATGGGGGGSTQPPLPTYFVHFDHLGSPTMLTCYKQPSSLGCPDGAVAMYFRYDAYGTFRAFDPQGDPVPEGTELTDRLYTGQRWESTPRLYDYRARFYDPEIARFTSLDPAREGVNLYAYVGWNPVARTDPSGMLTVPDVGAGVALSILSGTLPGERQPLVEPSLETMALFAAGQRRGAAMASALAQARAALAAAVAEALAELQQFQLGRLSQLAASGGGATNPEGEAGPLTLASYPAESIHGTSPPSSPAQAASTLLAAFIQAILRQQGLSSMAAEIALANAAKFYVGESLGRHGQPFWAVISYIPARRHDVGTVPSTPVAITFPALAVLNPPGIFSKTPSREYFPALYPSPSRSSGKRPLSRRPLTRSLTQVEPSRFSLAPGDPRPR
ncbi:MAG: hypothetical protein KatS3mg076_0099 [Candidatus Binatia bacterium]|nr:MAG: hypothetical protein KatS3mg076_0099 [Candidatus Binatia bacterium]